MRHLALFAFWSFAIIAAAKAQSHQGSFASCEGQAVTKVQPLDVAMPPAGRSYGWPSNAASIDRWGTEIMVAIRDYS